MCRNTTLSICFILVALLIGCSESSFVKTSGNKFVRDGRPFYFNGFNAYWLMTTASNSTTRYKVSDVFSEASKNGMNVARAWAFSDGGSYSPLQTYPGNYNQQTFSGLDFVVAEAKKYGIYLILSLVNNWNDYGGKKQYVEWGRSKGQSLKNDDEFFTNSVVKGFYKNNIKTMLTRYNTITKIAYKDDPTILAWELINEPHCESDLSGNTFQNWVAEMSGYVKSIDRNHLVEIGLEGYYGESKKSVNPNGYIVGTDFISNSRVPTIDFTTIHIYGEQWLSNASYAAQAQFVNQWVQSHISDSQSIGKPFVISEFGKSYKYPGYSVGARDSYLSEIYTSVYNCAKSGGPCGGALFWQVLDLGMENMGDGYEVVLQKSSSTDSIIYAQSKRMSSLN
ncbi:hypothetical protein ABFS83_08G218400 [Erythranthe nasuta]